MSSERYWSGPKSQEFGIEGLWLVRLALRRVGLRKGTGVGGDPRSSGKRDFDWLDLLNAELSPEKYWGGRRSQEFWFRRTLVGYTCLAPSCLRKGTGADGDPRSSG